MRDEADAVVVELAFGVTIPGGGPTGRFDCNGRDQAFAGEVVGTLALEVEISCQI
jgi:hypothetical protein